MVADEVFGVLKKKISNALAEAKQYTDDTAVGMGAVKGISPTVKHETEGDSIKVTFTYKDDEKGIYDTDSFDLPKGPEGEPGPKGDKGDPGTIVYKGAWQSDLDYSLYDMVVANGNSYLAKDNVPKGTPVTASNYWTVMCSADYGVISDAWSATKKYNANDYFIVVNQLYKCIQDAPVGTLPTDTNYFEKLTVGDALGALNRDLTEFKFKRYSEDSIYTYDNRPIIFDSNGNVIAVRIQGLMNVPKNQDITLCTIPAELLPLNQSIQMDLVLLDSTTPIKCRFGLISTGELRCRLYGTAGNFYDNNLELRLTFVKY